MGLSKKYVHTNLLNTSALSNASPSSTINGQIYSAPFHSKYVDNLAIQFNWGAWTATSGLGIVIDASNDYSAQAAVGSSGSQGYLPVNAGNFFPWIATSGLIGQPSVPGSSGISCLEIANCPHDWLRVRLPTAATSASTGTFSVWITGKEI